MSPLDRKLLRDLWHIKGQALAIAVVIGLGVAMLVMMNGLVTSLDETKRAYYERYRLADVFAPVKRAPEHILTDLGDISGVSAVVGRINGSALIELADIDVPIQAQAVSVPEFERPRLNDFSITAGRMIDAARDDEVLLLDSFALAQGLGPGNTIDATMNGARRAFVIAGLAQAPEFLITVPPGELAPDDARFAVLWMNEKALAAAYDLDGAFNEALLSLSRDARLPAVLDRVNAILEPYGGLGAYGIEDHVSNRFVTEEISGLRASSAAVPPIFMGVAAFLLYIVVSRILQSERGSIGLMKAFGYRNFEIVVHYGKLVLAIALLGAAIGIALGFAGGQALAGVYQAYYKFPFLIFQVSPATLLFGSGASLIAAAGGLLVLREVFALTPAVAMRPPAPADFSRTGRMSGWMARALDQPTRMVIRRLLRQPGRALSGAAGIAAGMALSVAMMSLMSAFDEAIRSNFTVIDRSDVTVSFVEPLSDETIHSLQRLDGVIYVEAFRSVSAILRHGLKTYRGGVSGYVAEPELVRAVGADMAPIYIREDGVILAEALAKILDIQPGEMLTLEIREGRRPTLQVPVVGVAKTLLGAPAYMRLGALNRTLKEPGRVSGAYLRIDPARGQEIYRKLKDMPAVAGVSLQSEARTSFKKLMDSGAGAIRYVMAIVAFIITFGIVYNSARIAFAERSRDLASLRVLGFTNGETAYVLLGELAVISLIALPVGSLLGYYLSLLVSEGFSTDLYQIPSIVVPDSYGIAAIAVLLAAAVSGYLVKRDVDRLELVSALKTRE